MSTHSATGAITLAVVFFAIVLSTLGWRYPSSISTRFLIGIILGCIGIVALAIVSDSINVFINEVGLAKTVAHVRPK